MKWRQRWQVVIPGRGSDVYNAFHGRIVDPTGSKAKKLVVESVPALVFKDSARKEGKQRKEQHII
eukprot:6763416-Pyramimonas_sp.AAC.2